ncbi:MAG: glycosyltransferase family 39 protein, partial [Anaerolineae bacterium]|nr:glycosyltransferase family 39 protein [Anaerolineae bacterium]
MQQCALLMLFALLFAQLLGAATRLSATVDEPFHITSGYEYLRTGELRLFDEHAPLAKALFAWPLFFVPDLSAPETAADYASGNLIAVTQAMLLAYRPLERVIVAPRVAAALLTLLFAATIFRCTASYAGTWVGLLALALCTFDPNFIAHGSLATTDMGATTFNFWALWAGMRWLQQSSWRRWLLVALLLGLAQGVKLTALLLYPILGIAVLLKAIVQRRQGAQVLRVLLDYAGIVGVSLLVLWVLYGCEVRPVAGVLGGV